MNAENSYGVVWVHASKRGLRYAGGGSSCSSEIGLMLFVIPRRAVDDNASWLKSTDKSASSESMEVVGDEGKGRADNLEGNAWERHGVETRELRRMSLRAKGEKWIALCCGRRKV